MRIIELDATKWETVLDFYYALLAAVEAPKGHGKSPDALIDSMIWGGMNMDLPHHESHIKNVSGAGTGRRDTAIREPGLRQCVQVVSDRPCGINGLAPRKLHPDS
jgi:hypothetical protein